MCATSAVFDYGYRIPTDRWTVPAWQDYLKLIDQAKQFDKVAQEPDCEDPKKAEWMKQMEERIAKLERQSRRKKVTTRGG